MLKLYAAIAAVAILAGAAYGLVEYGRVLERSDNDKIVTELQSALMDLGLVIQKQEGKAANSTRKLIESEGGRINAIATSSKRAEEIKRLEQAVRREQEKSKAKDADTTGDAVYYRVVDIGSFNRVWNEASSSGELPESISASVLSGGLSTITGTGINEAIKYCVGRYNACAIKYNSIWPTCDRLIKAGNKKPAN